MRRCDHAARAQCSLHGRQRAVALILIRLYIAILRRQCLHRDLLGRDGASRLRLAAHERIVLCMQFFFSAAVVEVVERFAGEDDLHRIRACWIAFVAEQGTDHIRRELISLL